MRYSRSLSWFATLTALGAAAAPAWAGTVSGPSTDPGWPISSLGGEVLRGPGDGVLEIGRALHGSREVLAMNAFRANAARQWSSGAGEECGNCAPVVPAGPRADRSYGPFGFTTAHTLYAVSADGLRRATDAGGCGGLVLPDSTCVASGPVGGPPSVRAVRDAALRWEYTDPGLANSLGGSDLRLLARDGAGTIFVSTEGGSLPPLLVALDADTGAVRMRQYPAARPGRLLGALDRGVLIGGAGSVSAIGEDGVLRWQAAATDVTRALVDPVARRVYLERDVTDTRRSRRRVLALNLDTGDPVWERGAAASLRLMSIGAGGVLLARDAGSRHDLRELRPDGSVRWRWPALAAVDSAVTASDRHVFANVGALQGATSPGLLFRLDPAGPRAHSPWAASVHLRRRPEPRCAPSSCALTGREGTVLRISMPRATRVRWALGPSPLKRPYAYSGVVSAPAGPSSVRVFVPPSLAKRRISVRLWWRQGSRTLSRILTAG